jgi:predicted phosphoribosyltransferase
MSEAVDLAAIAVAWPVHSVLERRLDELVVRSLGVGA